MIPQDYEMGLRPERRKTKPQAVKTLSGVSAPRHVRQGRGCGADVEARYREAVENYGPGATWCETVSYWGVAKYGADTPFEEVDAGDDETVTEITESIVADIEANGVTMTSERRGKLKRSVRRAIARQIAYWEERGNGRNRRRTRRHAPPKPSRAVEDCVEEGRRAACTTFDALMDLSPVDVRGMDADTQRGAQLAAMFDRPGLRALPVGIMPRKGAWTPCAGRDFMSVTDWLADGARLATAGELVKINPFTGASEDCGDGKPHLATNATIAAFPHALMEFDDMPLPDQCAFWHGAITLYHLPVVALVYSGGESIHGVVRVDCTSGAEYRKAAELAKRVFAKSPNPSMKLDDKTLSPIFAARLAGCIRADTGRTQRLLYLTANTSAGPQNPPSARSAPQARNLAPETDGRATGQGIGVSARVPPTETDTTDFAEILAEEECIEAWVAAGGGGVSRIPRQKTPCAQGARYRGFDT